MESVIFPLSHFRFPALVNLKDLTIFTGVTTDEILYVLQSINYPTMMPVLETVEVLDREEGEMLYVNPWGNNGAIPVPSRNYCPSATVKKLFLEFDVDKTSLEVCGRIFPNVSRLSLSQMMTEAGGIPYEDLWAHLSQVEILEITKAYMELGENLDAAFLGINQEEVDLLRKMDDKSLETMNIVPVRSSILTMRRKIHVNPKF